MAKDSLAAKGVEECKKTLSLVESIHLDITELRRAADNLAVRIGGLQAQMNELAAAGLNDGKPRWRHNKYLSLVHPAKKGTRRSEYIGSDRLKIEKALAGVARCKTYRAHLTEIESCARKWRAVRRLLAQCISHISED